MSQTTYYEFNKPIGTDLVNPLVDTIPNWDIADTALHGLSVNSIGTALEVITGTVHALTRVNQTDAKFIQFIASGDYDEGDTFTLDGVAIGATYPDGTSLATDAYATGATVLIGLNSDNSVATFYLSAAGGTAPDSERLGGELPAYYASKSYADGIKSTADAAAEQITKKALVNTYYDPVGKKLYQVLSDGSQGGEIVMKPELNFANKVELTTSAITTTAAGAVIGTIQNAAGSTTRVAVVIAGSQYQSAVSTTESVEINFIPSGTSLSLSSANNSGAHVYFVPYK